MDNNNNNILGRKPLKAGEVNREKTCPLLLRVFWKNNEHHRAEDYERRRRELSKQELLIYTWKDATLRELTELIKEVQKSAQHKNAKLSFAFVYPDKSGRMVLKEVGSCYSFAKQGSSNTDDNKTLDELHFETGDFLDVAIFS